MSNQNQTIYAWNSSNPDINGDIDQLAQFPEGMAPGQVNDSARGIMTRVAQFIKDYSHNSDNNTNLTPSYTVSGQVISFSLSCPVDDLSELEGIPLNFRIVSNQTAIPDQPLVNIANIQNNKQSSQWASNAIPVIGYAYLPAVGKTGDPNYQPAGLYVRRVKADEFLPGSQITLIYSSKDHIYDESRYSKEQKAGIHLMGDLSAMLQTDPLWEVYKNDLGVWWLIPGSSWGAIGDIAKDTASDVINNTVYGCTAFPTMNSKDFTNPVIPLAVAKSTDKDGCMKIVQNPSSSRMLIVMNETVKNTSPTNGIVFPQDSSNGFDGSMCYSVKALADTLRYHVPQGDHYPYAVNLADEIAAGKLDAPKLNNSLVSSAELTLQSDLSALYIQLGVIISYNPDAMAKQNVSYIIFAVDDVIHLAGDGLIENGDYQIVPQRQGTQNDIVYVGASTKDNPDIVFKAGTHTIKAYVFPQYDNFTNPMTKIYLEGGRAPYGTPLYRFSANVQIPLS